MIPHASFFEIELALHDLDTTGLELLRLSLDEAAQRLARRGVAVRCVEVCSTIERGCVAVFQALEPSSLNGLLEMANVPVTGARISRTGARRSAPVQG